MKPPRKLVETDLYKPLRNYLESHGYTVRGEVHGCDVTAVKEDELVVIEMKRQLNLDLIIQAALRQRIGDSVYVAVPRPAESMRSKRWRGLTHLLRRLELGLILITPNARSGRVEVAFHPAPFQRRKQGRARRAVLREIAGRTMDANMGGSNRRKLVTAYRETAIHIACRLAENGAMSPRDLRGLGTGPKTQTILYDNVYGWFDRVGTGLYQLNAKGIEGLTEFDTVAALFRRKTD